MSTVQLWDNPLAFVTLLVSIPLLLIAVAWLTERVMDSVRGQVADRRLGGLDSNPVVENLPLKENRGN